MAQQLGVVTGGSFNDGLTVRLDAAQSTEAIQVGNFVVIEGEDNRYFSTIADLELRLTDPALAADPPPATSPFLRAALAGVHTYAVAQVKPSLMLADKDELIGGGPKPVRTIPMHFAILREAGAVDFSNVFGEEDAEGTKFALGTPLTMDQPIPLDLKRLVERSNGVFGQSGTGKSVLTRLLLCGVIKAGLASALIFDMHSEYAWQKEGEGGAQLRGLRDLFGSKIGVYSLDERDAARQPLDATFKIGMNQIEPGDIELLADELNLTATFAATAHSLHSRYGERWLAALLDMDADELKEFCASSGANEMAVGSLKQKLGLLQKLPYIVPHLTDSATGDLLNRLRRKEHVVLQFGQHSRLLDYMLVANIITRRIYASWVDRTERYLQTKNPADQPRRLVLCIEEAHKFLNPQAARNTSFGTIAREMRKYNVTLLIVDQRPSGIDPEVASQLGTRLTALLTEESDIRAVFSGVSGADQLRTVLASLDTKKQALILGHAVPMPIVVRVREYDETFFKAMAPPPAIRRPAGMAALQEAFG